jgi:hypothetical protein
VRRGKKESGSQIENLKAKIKPKSMLIRWKSKDKSSSVSGSSKKKRKGREGKKFIKYLSSSGGRESCEACVTRREHFDLRLKAERTLPDGFVSAQLSFVHN